jgi:hypothetical protein
LQQSGRAALSAAAPQLSQSSISTLLLLVEQPCNQLYCPLA